MIPFSEAFAYIVRKEREHRKWSKATLAEKAGLHQTYIGLLEAGKRSPNVDTVQAIAKAFDMRPSGLAIASEKIQDAIDKAGGLENFLEEQKKRANKK